MPLTIAGIGRAILGTQPPLGAGVPPRSARTMPPRLRFYIGAVVLAYVTLQVALAIGGWPTLGPGGWGTAGNIALLVALARVFPVRLAPKRKMVVDTAPSFAAALLLPPAVAMLAGAGGMGLGELRVRGRWFQLTFNSAVSGLRVGVAAFLFRFVAGIRLGDSASFTVHPAAMLAAGLSLYLTGSTMVDIAAGLTLGQNPFANWMAAQRRKLPVESVLLMLGLFAALPARDNPWLLPLLIVPAAVVRYSLQESIPVRSETRDALESLAEAVDLRHHRAADHSRRVSELSRAIARRMDLALRDVTLITDAARLRDIGEVALPPDLLTHASPLTEEQRVELRRHTAIGATMVQRFPDFAECSLLILHHHERWDGWGAPDGLTGDAIPLGARVIAVAETYEALIASRPYRDALSPEQARAELRRAAGSQLDPTIVRVLFDLLGYDATGQTLVEAPLPVRLAIGPAQSGGGP